MHVQPRFRFAVTDLLAPERRDAGAMVMPHQCAGRKPDPHSARLQPPADVDIVAGAQVDRVEAADREQRVAPESHVAARDVLRDAVVYPDPLSQILRVRGLELQRRQIKPRLLVHVVVAAGTILLRKRIHARRTRKTHPCDE